MKNIIQSVKEISDLIQKYNDQDLYKKIIELRENILSLEEENFTLKEKIRKKKKINDIKSRIKREGNCYFLYEKDGSKVGPYCMTCRDSDKKLVNLIEDTISYGREDRHTIRCNICSARKGKAD